MSNIAQQKGTQPGGSSNPPPAGRTSGPQYPPPGSQGFGSQGSAPSGPQDRYGPSVGTVGSQYPSSGSVSQGAYGSQGPAGAPQGNYGGPPPSAGHPGDPRSGAPPQSSYPGNPPPGSYPGGPPQGSYPGGPPQGSYHGGPPTGGYPGGPPQGGYPGGYGGQPGGFGGTQGGGYGGSPHGGGYGGPSQGSGYGGPPHGSGYGGPPHGSGYGGTPHGPGAQYPPRGGHPGGPGPYNPSQYSPAGFNPNPPSTFKGWYAQFYHQLDPQSLQNLRLWFEGVDKDRSGQIDANELSQMVIPGNGKFAGKKLGKLGADSLMMLFDNDKSGSIDFYEYAALWQFLNSMQNAFQRADTDNGGTLDEREIHRAMQEGGFPLQPFAVHLYFNKYNSTGRGLDLISFLLMVADVAQIKTKMDTFDRDYDGYVNFEEVLQIIESIREDDEKVRKSEKLVKQNASGPVSAKPGAPKPQSGYPSHTSSKPLVTQKQGKKAAKKAYKTSQGCDSCIM